MRILMVAQSFAPVVGGEERIVEDLSAELSRRGHEVVVATLAQPLGPPPPRSDRVEVVALRSATRSLPGLATDSERAYAPPLPDPLAVRGLSRVIARFRPEVVHAHNWLSHSYLPLARRRGGPAFVLSLHDYSLVCATKRYFYDGAVCPGPAVGRCVRHSVEHYGPAKGLVAAAGTRVAGPLLRRRVDVFLPVSEAVRELSGIDEGVPHRIVPNFVGSLPPPPGEERRLAALPERPFILYFGDVTEDKGVGCLLEAYRDLVDPPPLVLIGRQLLDGAGTVAGVTALEPMPHPLVIEALRRSLFSVAPSLLPESFGIVALEAAAAAKPTIATRLGGLADVVVDGETGLLVAPGDVSGLREALHCLCTDEEARKRMGAAAARRAAQFSPDAVVPKFESAYRFAVGRRAQCAGASGR